MIDAMAHRIAQRVACVRGGRNGRCNNLHGAAHFFHVECVLQALQPSDWAEGAVESGGMVRALDPDDAEWKAYQWEHGGLRYSRTGEFYGLPGEPLYRRPKEER